jgi:tetratricopeptide (TPR) repeat protein
MLGLLLALAAGTEALDRGTEAVEQFRVEEAIELLEWARAEGPYRHADHIRLYEQLGIALAYAERKQEAIEAFDWMLALAPDHALSYSLSPKATLVFQEARQRAAAREAPALDLGLPRDRTVTDPLPIDLDVRADPFHFLHHAELYFRLPGEEWRVERLALGDPSGRHRVVLPPPAPGAVAQVALQLWVRVLDERDNEVMALGSPERPRELSLGFVPPEPWYGRWWIWTAVGVAVVAGTAAAVAAGARDPDPEIDVIVRKR